MNNLFDYVNEDIEYIDVYKNFKSGPQFSVISLFSGCGGMDLGFTGNFEIFGKKYAKNNFEIIFANEINTKACETYKENFGHAPICEDINNIDNQSFPNADIVIGGFPCQDFSLAGKRQGLEAERGRLYLQMKRVIDNVKPKAFIAENVDGIRITKKGEDISALNVIIEDFKNSGYDVKYKLLHAADYGVPQTRKRVIIIGVRKDLHLPIFYPKPTHYENSITTPWMTSKEAIDDLWDKVDSGDIYNHTIKDISKAKFYLGGKGQGNYCIKSDKPSCTIRAEHHGNIEGHYRAFNNDSSDINNWRRLSVRECARIQTFPDNFKFMSAASSAYKQVGNAVPPILAWHIARALYITLTSK